MPLAHSDLDHNATCPKCRKGVDHEEALRRDASTREPFTCGGCGCRFTVYCHQLFESVEEAPKDACPKCGTGPDEHEPAGDGSDPNRVWCSKCGGTWWKT